MPRPCPRLWAKMAEAMSISMCNHDHYLHHDQSMISISISTIVIMTVISMMIFNVVIVLISSRASSWSRLARSIYMHRFGFKSNEDILYSPPQAP